MPRIRGDRLSSPEEHRDRRAIWPPSTRPTWDEIALANAHGQRGAARVCFLVLLKTFQRLGYPVPLAEVPAVIVEHIARTVGLPTPPSSRAAYDASGRAGGTCARSAPTWACAPSTRAARHSCSAPWTRRPGPRTT